MSRCLASGPYFITSSKILKKIWMHTVESLIQIDGVFKASIEKEPLSKVCRKHLSFTSCFWFRCSLARVHTLGHSSAIITSSTFFFYSLLSCFILYWMIWHILLIIPMTSLYSDSYGSSLTRSWFSISPIISSKSLLSSFFDSSLPPLVSIYPESFFSANFCYMVFIAFSY